MADYGKNTIGASNEAIAANNKRFCKFTSPASIGAVDSITAYVDRSGTGGSYAIDGAIYTDNAGAPNALVANSAIEISSNIARNSPNWYSVNYVTKPTLSPNTPYWLGILATKASITYYDTGASNQEAMNADTLPFDATFGSPTYHAHAMSVYVSYTAGTTVTLAGTSSGAATVTSEPIKRTRYVSSQIAGTSTVASNPLQRSMSIKGLIAGTATSSGALNRLRSMAGAVAGAASVDSVIKLARSLASAIAGVATTNVALTIGGGVLRALAGVANGVATVTSSISRSLNFQSSIAGVATVTTSISRLRNMASLVAGVATVTSAVVRQRTFQVLVDGVATTTASLQRSTAFKALVSGTATVQGILGEAIVSANQILLKIWFALR